MGKLAVTVISIVTFVVYFLVLIVPTFSYGRMILAFLIVAGAGVVLLLVARFAVTVTRTVTLNGVGTGFAIRSAHQAIWAAEDHVVGWPSGTFVTKWDGERDVLVATEFLPKGSGNIVLSFIRVPWAIAMWIVAAFSVFGFFGLVVGVVLAVFAFGTFLYFFVFPLALAWLVEIVFKRPVSSVIEVTAADLTDAAELTFRFRGASALLVKNKVMNAFNAPQLPARYAGLIDPTVSVSTAASPAPLSSAVG